MAGGETFDFPPNSKTGTRVYRGFHFLSYHLAWGREDILNLPLQSNHAGLGFRVGPLEEAWFRI